MKNCSLRTTPDLQTILCGGASQALKLRGLGVEHLQEPKESPQGHIFVGYIIAGHSKLDFSATLRFTEELTLQSGIMELHVPGAKFTILSRYEREVLTHESECRI